MKPVERLRSENARLQDLLDRRPALNGGLLDAYMQWNRLCYLSSMAAARQPQSEVH